MKLPEQGALLVLRMTGYVMLFAPLVVIAATLSYLGLPEEGLLLLLAVDHFLDMGRSATNVLGNSIAAAAVARMEGQLRDPDHDPEHAIFINRAL